MGTYSGKTITVKEMRELGLLQELNRTFFHPLGLALEVIIDDKTGEERIERLWDNRDDPEGWVFDDGLIDAEKAKAIQAQFEERAQVRLSTLGFVIQPLP